MPIRRLEDIPFAEYRSDGWPLCPRCGEDELMSREVHPTPLDWLKCLQCGWAGEIPPKAVVDELRRKG